MMTNNEPSLLIVSGARGSPRRYRTLHLYEQANLAGLKCQLSHITDPELEKKAKQSTLIIIHRALYDAQIASLSQAFHLKDGVLIHDIDDLVFEPEMFQYIDSVDFADSLRANLYQEEIQLYRQCIEACDAVLTSTEFLAKRVQGLGKPVQVHRNAFSLEMLALSEKANKSRRGMDERFVIGYASGTATHNQDFALVKPALLTIMQKYANTELWLIGPVDPGKAWGSMGDRVHRIKMVPWRDLPALQAQFDINLAPVCTDNPFGQSKSEIKFVEAALVMVPTIASPSEAFKLAIRHNINGYLASTTKEWVATLEHLIYEPKYRREIGEIAYQDVLEHYHPQVRARELVSTLSHLTGKKFQKPSQLVNIEPVMPGSSQSFWSSASVEKTPSLLQMAVYTLRQRGISVLLKQVRIYIRRWLAPVIPYT